jgi:hypothetical protein
MGKASMEVIDDCAPKMDNGTSLAEHMRVNKVEWNLLRTKPHEERSSECEG